MKNEISVPVIVTIVIVVVLLAGLIGWKVLGGNSGHVDAATLAATKARKTQKDGGD